MKHPKILKWVLSPHAVSRMMERKITSEELDLILTKPDFTIQQGSKWIFAKKFQYRRDNSIAAVLVEREDKNLWVVITVMVRFEVK